VSGTEPGIDARALARLRNRSAFERQVSGSLRSTIAAHGPIGQREIGSAASGRLPGLRVAARGGRPPVRRDEAAQRHVREIATLLRLAADDLDKPGRRPPGAERGGGRARVEESTSMTRAAIASIAAEGAE
jgi:hypothetical protein